MAPPKGPMQHPTIENKTPFGKGETRNGASSQPVFDILFARFGVQFTNLPINWPPGQ
jgi:hypothetical protein